MRKSKLLALLLAVAMVISMIIVPAYASDAYGINMVASKETVAPGETFTVTVSTKGTIPDFGSTTPGLSAIGIDVLYPADLAVSGYEYDADLLAVLPSKTTPANTANPMRFFATSDGATEYVGDVVVITFTAPAETGTYTINAVPADKNYEDGKPGGFNYDYDLNDFDAQMASAALTITVASDEPAGTTGTCPECDGEVTWADFPAITEGALSSGHYKLTGDVTLTAALTVAAGQTVCIDLAGHTIDADASKTNSHRAIESSGVLTITDSATGGTITGGFVREDPSADTHYYGGNIFVTGEGAELNLHGGTVTGGIMDSKNETGATSTFKCHIYGANIGATAGAVVNVYEGASVTDGSISMPQQATYYHGGGNIYATGATVNIYGGTISGGSVVALYDYSSSANRKAYAAGGNIAVAGASVLNISGGTIKDGTVNADCRIKDAGSASAATAHAYGGNIFVGGTSVASITGGTISGGSAISNGKSGSGKILSYAYGGSVYVGADASLTLSENANISGGTVTATGTSTSTSNEIYPRGGNIYVAGTATINGNTVISGGTAVGNITNCRGGNIFVADGGGKLTMNNGTITEGYSGVVDGEYGNARGGNLFVLGTFDFYGGTISNGTAGWGADIMTPYGGKFNMYGGTISGNGTEISYYNQRGTFKMYGGTIKAPGSKTTATLTGTSTSNGSTNYIYGGTIEGVVKVTQVSAVTMCGGIIGKMQASGSGAYTVNVYGGSIGSVTATGSGTALIYNAAIGGDLADTLVAGCATATDVAGGCIVTQTNLTDGACATCGHTYTGTCATCTVSHPGYTTSKTGACEHCDGEAVEWTPWLGGSFTASGHYFLPADTALTATVSISDNQTVCLDLNGKTLLGYANTRVFTLNGESTVLNIMDSSVAEGAASYSGTGVIKASGIYKDSYNGGAVIYSAGNEVNLYSGTITDGHVDAATEHTSGGRGTAYGGNVYLNEGAVMNMYGGHITNGTADYRGGNIAVFAQSTLHLSGDAKVTNGKLYDVTSVGAITNTAARGSNIMLSQSTLTMQDNVEVSGGQYGMKDGRDIMFYKSVGRISGGSIPTGHITVSSDDDVQISNTFIGNNYEDEYLSEMLGENVKSAAKDADGNYKFVETFADALAFAGDSGSIKLTGNVSAGGTLNTGATIDLNGKELAGADVVTGGVLNVVDTSADVSGRIISATGFQTPEDSEYLPIKVADNTYAVEKIGFEYKPELKKSDDGLYRFIFRFNKQDAEKTALDSALDYADITISVVLNYIDGESVPREESFDVPTELYEAYKNGLATKAIQLKIDEETNNCTLISAMAVITSTAVNQSVSGDVQSVAQN